MRFEAEYKLKNFREVQEDYFNELGECWNRDVLSKEFAEQCKETIDELESEILFIEGKLKRLLENVPDNLKTVIEAYFKQEIEILVNA